MAFVSGAANRALAPYAQSAVLSALGRITYGRLHILLNEEKAGKALSFGPDSNAPDAPEVTLTILDSSIWMRLCLNLDVGFAEAYMLNQIECSNLGDLFVLYIRNWDAIGNGNYLFQCIPKLLRLAAQPANDPAHALRNASFHYDTSNSLFASFLSSDMNYSCPVWANDPMEPLEMAQLRKVHNIIAKARIAATDHVLDIGCGWGHLAIEAAKRTGCRVTGVTLSKEQKALAERRIADAGLTDRIQILLCDYRAIPPTPGGYDRVVSVEMLEHVGREHMDAFFGCVSNLLKPEGGVMVVQGITVINRIYGRRGGDNFIDVYVFPGGDLPCVARLLDAVDKGSNGDLEVDDVQSIGPHYAKALRCWKENFERNWEGYRDVFVKERPGMGEAEVEAFRRRWIYYFTYCEAGFRTNILGDHVITAVRRPQPLPDYVPL